MMTITGAYRVLTRLAAPLIRLYLHRRVRRGKEDPARLAERFGIAMHPRPAGRLVWMHGASVGESLSLLPLVDRLLARDSGLSVLVTTGTVSSAQLIATRLPPNSPTIFPRAFHQYLPVDDQRSVARFLDHWHPDLALWVESELWPNLVLETRRRGTAMALVNARLSVRSFEGWRRWPGLIGPMLNSFDIVLAQDATQATRLMRLGAAHAETVGDLKAAASPLAGDPAALDAANALLAGRPRWLAASTHRGEEAVVVDAHNLLAQTHPGLLTVLAPRHPARGGEVAADLAKAGLRVVRRSAGTPIEAGTQVYLVDTMGELGLFYRLAPIVLVGGSLGAPGSIGGHNPLEAAMLGCAILHGPDMVNCAAIAATLDASGAAEEIGDAAELAAAVGALLADPGLVARRAEAASAIAAAERGVVDRVLAKLDRLLPPVVERAPEAGKARHALA